MRRKVLATCLFFVTTSLVAASAMPADERVADSGIGSPESHHVITVYFATGAANLPESEHNALDSILRSAVRLEQMEEFTLAVWSDKPYGSGAGELNAKDRMLASKRVEALQKFLYSRFPDVRMRTFNMSHPPSLWAEIFSTRDAKLKWYFAGNYPAPPTTEIKTIFDEGGPSTAVVIIYTRGGKKDLEMGRPGRVAD